MRPSRPASSTLFTTRSTCPRARSRTTVATRLSSSVTPVTASATTSTTSASRIACSLCAAHLVVERGALRDPAPGVDQRERHALPVGVDELPVAGDAGLLLHDRDSLPHDPVDEGGLADVGPADDRDGGFGHPGVERGAQRVAVGGDDLHRSGQVLRAGAVEEPAVGEADVGQEVAVALGLVGEDPGEVLPHQQTGDARRAAEELVVDGNDPHVGPVETARAAAPAPARRRCW